MVPANKVKQKNHETLKLDRKDSNSTCLFERRKNEVLIRKHLLQGYPSSSWSP